MWKEVGIIRSEETLAHALNIITEVERKLDYTPCTKSEIELNNLALSAKLITQAALDRKESRGAHYRSDYPNTDNINWQKHLIYKLP